MPLRNPPIAPNRRFPAQFPDQLEDYLAWIGSDLVPEMNRLAPALNSTTAALNRANHFGTQGIDTIAGLIESLDARARTSHSHSIEQITGLRTELNQRLTLIRADRPGDNPRAFTVNSTGNPVLRPAMSYPVEAVAGLGRVPRITGAGDLCLREPIAIGSDTHQITARVQRAANPADPNNHAVQLRVTWLDANYEVLPTNGNSIAASVTNLTVGSGLVEMTRAISPLGLNGALVPPEGAIYFTPFVRTYGSDGATWIATLRRSEVLVQAIVGGTDLTAVITQAQAATAAAQAAANSYRGEVVNGFAAVQAYTRPVNVAAIMVAWGTAPWDGQGGEYARDAADTTTAHTPPEVLVGADGTRWKRISGAFDALRLDTLENNESWQNSRIEDLEAVNYDAVLARIAALEQNGTGGSASPALTASVADHETRLDGLEAWAANTVIGTETGANIASASHAINTTGKAAGKFVWDSTNNVLLRASGSSATAPWYLVGGTGSVTPGGAVVLPPVSNLTWESITQQANGPIVVGGREWKFNTALLPHSVRRLAGNADWLKFLVRDGDMRAGDPSDRHRSELSGSDFPFSAAAGELWVSQWAIPLQQSACWFNASFQVFDNGYNSPSAKLEERGGTGQEINIAGGLSSSRLQTPAWQGPRFQTGRRYHRLWRIVQDPQYGELDFWVNGVLIVSLRNVGIGQGSVPSCYLKYGQYCDDNNLPMGDQEIIFGPMTIATGTNALLSHRDAPPAMPSVLSALYPTGEFGLGTKVIVDGLPSGGVEPGANILDSIAAPTLEVYNSTGGLATYSASTHRLQLRGNDTNYGARAIWAIPTVQGETYQYFGNLTTTSMNSRVGTTIGGAEVLASIVHQPGQVGRSFPGTGGTVYLMFNKQSAANTATLSDMALTGPS